MRTQKPLREMLPEIMEHIRNHQDYLAYNNRLMLVHEGQLRREIEDSLAQELSPKALARAIKRIPSINVLVRIIDKLSRVYAEPAQRTAGQDSDEPALRYYEKQLKLANVLPNANRMLNLHKSCALEPYLCEGEPSLRVLPANQFLVYSDSPVDPLKPTVFIKIMGRELKTPFTDRQGQKLTRDDKEPRWVDVYCLYSDDEILIVDSDITVRQDKMEARGMDGTNPIGQIPFVYLNRSDFRLIPLPDTDTLDNTILIPKLLADLNYAVQFQSHSVVVATDLTLPDSVTWSPDVIVELKTDEGSTQQGQVTTIKPEVDIDQVLRLIESTLSMWLEARNIKTTGSAQVTAEAAASGVAKLIDESDASQDRRAQMIVFEAVEAELWTLLAAMHEYWQRAGANVDAVSFSDNFSVGVQFANMQPMKSEQQEVETVKELMTNGLMDKRMALRRIYPHMKAEEIEALLKATGGNETTLNGAQLESLINLVTAVALRQVPRDAAQSIIVQAFAVTPEVAANMLGSAGESFNAEVKQQGFGGTGGGDLGQGQGGSNQGSGQVDNGTAALTDA